MNILRQLPFVFALIAILCSPAQALDSFTWQFDGATNYAFDAELVQVRDSQGKLILLADELVDGDVADHTTAVQRVNITLGTEQSIRLTKDHLSLYESPGTFISRIFEAGSGNEWKRITMASSSARYISDPTIVMLAQFDNNWLDQVSENSATVVGSSSFTTDAVQGTHALALNGSLYGSYSDNPLTGNDALTLSLWLYNSGYVGFAGAVTSGGSAQFRLRQRSTSEKVLEVRVSTSGGSFVIQEPLPLNRWQHWVLTWDATVTGDGFPKLYVDGQLVQVGLSSIIGQLLSNGPLFVGTDYEVPAQRGWNGRIDDLFILDRALTAAEVERAFAGQSAVFESVNFQVRSGTNVAQLLSRPFTGSDGTVNSTYVSGTSEIAAGAAFNTFDRLVQYRAELRSDKDGTRTPYLEGIRFEGSGVTLTDNTDYDFSLGQFESNVVLFSESGVRPFLGAAKQENGGYYENSVFYSRTFDAGEPVTWQQLAWETTQGVVEDEFGLISLYHVNGNWNDSRSTRTVFDLSNAEFTAFAKIGSRSARFNGVNNVLTGFGNFGTVETIEFWIKAARPNTPVMSINAGNYITVERSRLRWVGTRDSDATIYVNGSDEATHLLSGWNHVAIVLEPGVPLSTLIVGEVPSVGFFAGDLDEVAFYNRPLLTGEIRGHFANGERIASGEVRFQVADSTLTNFVGPGGSPSSFFLVSPFGEDPNLLGAIPAQQFFRYKAVMDGDGNATPKIRSVKIATAFPHGQIYRDQTAQDFAAGEFVTGSAVYGAVLGFDSTGAIGPENLSPLAFGLVGLWHFDDPTWATGERPVKAAFGSSGFAFGNAVVSFGAKVGTRSGLFNGSSAYLDSLGTVLPVGNSDFSVSFWFQTSSGQSSTICALDDSSRYFVFRIGSVTPGDLSFVVNDNLGEEAVFSSRESLNDDRWHHVVGVRTANQILMYVDGEIVGSKDVPGLGVVGIAQNLIVAKDPVLNVFFEGFIDEVAVFNRALTDADVGALLGGTSRANTLGTFESEVVVRDEPTIWQSLAWVPDSPHGKGLTSLADDPYQIGVWHFDELSGVASNAVQGNAQLTGAVNGPQRGVSGRFLKAFDFNGANDDHVEISDDAVFVRSPEQLSVEAWVFPRAGENRGIVDKTSGGDGFALTSGTSGEPEFYVGGATASGLVGLRLDRWNHLAGTYDAEGLRLYVNGELTSTAGVGGGSSSTSADFWIGRSRQGRQSFEGAIDEVAYYTRVLGAEEVLDHFRVGAAALKFQVRSGTNQVITTPYVGDGGTTADFFNDHFGDDTQDETVLSKYFQYLAKFSSESHFYPPVLNSIIVEASGYAASNPGIEPKLGFAPNFLGHITGFSHLRINNPDTQVKYQLSGDVGETNSWYYYNATQQQWTEVNPSGSDEYLFQANDIAVVQDNVDTFYTDVYNARGGEFRFRALLHSLGEYVSGLDFVTVDYAVGRIVILQPNGEERGEKSLLVGVPEEVLWDFAGQVTGTVTIEYSTDGGLIWRNTVPPATAVPHDDRLYIWTTPAAASTQALIRITSNSDPSIFDVSDEPFELGVGYTIVDNNGGTNHWYIGETNVIRWKKSFQIGAAHLEFSRDGSFSTNNKVRITSTTVGPFPVNSYTWVTPTTNANLIGTQGKLRAVNAQATVKDDSDQSFELRGAVVTSPGTGAAVKKDAAFDLKWRSAGMGASVKIEVQVVPAGPWTLVDAAAPNTDGDNLYVWTPTNTPTDTARLRFSSATDVRARGLTEEFKIAAIELINPLGHPDLAFSDVWLQGTTQTITWVSGGADDFVNVQFSINGAAGPYMTIASNFPNANIGGFTNEYVWIVEPFPSDKVRIRIEDAARPEELSSVTPFDFQIAGLRVDWPNGGEEWPLGQRLDAQWVQNALGIEGRVEISYDDKATWNLITDGFVLQNNSQSYTPTNATLNGFVRVTALAPPAFTNLVLSDSSDTRFAVAGVEILQPAAAVEYTIGQNNVIRFRIAATHDDNNAAEYYYSPGGGAFDLLNRLNSDTDVFQDGAIHSFNWLVDEDRKPSFGARIQIKAGIYTSVSPLFTLRGIRFEAPLLNQTVRSGNYNILWSHAGLDTAAKVDMRLSLNGRAGPYDTVIGTDLFLTDELLNWNVPQGLGPSTNAVLRIEVTAAPGEVLDVGYTAFSRVFNLRGLRVDTPSSGDQPAHNTDQSIAWTAADGGALVDIFYSPDGGVTDESDPIAVFVDSQDGPNAINWSIEAFRTPSTNAVVRVVSQAHAGLEGVSEPFTLQGIQVTRPTRFDIYSTTDAMSPISWVGVNAAGAVPYSIYYLIGTNQTLITTGENGPTYDWVIPPEAVSDDIRIVITDGTFVNTSDTFRVVDQPTVEVSSPASEAFWKISETYTVKWLRGGAMTNDFTVYYSTSPYVDTNLIATAGSVTFNATENAFETTWKVPDSLGPTRIIVQNNTLIAVRDVSEPFNIVGQFEMVTPIDDASLFALRPGEPVIWDTLGNVKFVDLYYSISLQHEADSWVKINSAPIANNATPYTDNATDDDWVRSSFPWTVANARTTHAKIRVQEAAYPQSFDLNFDGPFASSLGEFDIIYYTVYWDVYDAASGQRLDFVSVIDSSGWSESSLSSISPNVIKNDYAWGTYNTEIYREGFFDAPVLFWDAENTDISVPGPQVWTQDVAMVRSLTAPDAKVLANFSYDTIDRKFTIHSWIERGGSIIETPTSSRITIYDRDGNQVDSLPHDAFLANGIFLTDWSVPAQYDNRDVFFAKVEIELSGVTFSSGLTFTLVVPLGDEILGPLDDLAGVLTSNVFDSISGVLTNIAGLTDGFSSLEDVTREGFTNISRLVQAATGMIDRVRSDVAGVSNELVNVIAPKIDSIASNVVNIAADVKVAVARILTRPESVAFGSTNSLLYRTQAGFDPGIVKWEVRNAANAIVDSGVMTSVIAGIYEASYVADWGVNTYKIRAFDPGGEDTILVRVVTYDPLTVPDMIAAVTNELELLSSQVITMAAVNSELTNMFPILDNINLDLLATALDISSLTNALLGVDFLQVEESINNLTNDLSVLANLDQIAEQIALLTNSISTIAELTNISESVSALTNALNGFNAGDVLAIKNDLRLFTNRLAVIDWEQVNRIEQDVSGISNTVGSLDLMASQMVVLTNKLVGVDFVRMASTVEDLTNTLIGLGDIADQLAGITNTLGTDFDQLAGQLNSITGTLTQLDNVVFKLDSITNVIGDVSLSIMARNVADLTNAVLSVDFADLALNVNSLTNVFPSLAGVSGQLELITNVLFGVDFASIESGVFSISNVIADLQGIDTQIQNIDLRTRDANFGNVDFELMFDEITSISNILAGVGGLEAIAQEIGNLSNSISQISSLTNLSTTVNALGTKLLPFDFDQLLTDSTFTTNALGGLSGLLDLTDQLSGLSSSVTALASVTNLAIQLDDIHQRLNVQVDFAQLNLDIASVTNTLAGLSGLAGISGQLSGLSSSVVALAAVTNISEQVDSLATALLVNEDYRNIFRDLTTVTNQLNALSGLQALTASISSLSTSVTSLAGITNIEAQVGEVFAAIQGVDFSVIEGGVTSLSNQLADVNWQDLTAIGSDVRYLTNEFAAVGSLGDVARDLAGITNAIARLSNVTNIGAEIANITNALNGLDWSDILEIRSMLVSVTNELGTLEALNDIQQIVATLADVTNSVAKLDGLTNVPTQVDAMSAQLAGVNFLQLTADVGSLTNTMAVINWDDIDEIRAEVFNITNALGALPDLPALLAEITNLTNAFDELRSVTNVSSSIDAIVAAIGNVTFESMASDVRVLTNEIAQLNLDAMEDIRRDVSDVTNLLQGITFDSLVEIQRGVGEVTSTLARVSFELLEEIFEDTTFMTNLTGELQALVNSVNPLLALTNSIQQLAGITNISGEVSNITNALNGLNWNDITEIQTLVRNMTNDLALLRNITGEIGGLTNLIASGSSGLTNLTTQVDDILAKVQDFNWDTILKVSTDVENITNAVIQISGLDAVANTLNGLTNAIVQLAGITNIGAEVGNLTNALSGLNWADVIDIQTKVNAITNTLAGLSDIDALASIMQGLTNSLAEISGVTNLEDRIKIVQKSVTNIVWSEITRMSKSVEALTNDLSSITGLGGTLTNLVGSINAVIAVTNVQKSVDTLATTFATARWTDITQIGSSLSSLSSQLQGVSGVNLQTLDPASLGRIEQQLARMQNEGGGSASIISEIERLLGSSSAQGDTVLSRLNDILSSLNTIGRDASDASSKASSAKSQASSASAAASAAKQAIEEGDLSQAMASIRQIMSDVRSAQQDLKSIPQDEQNSRVFDRVREMAETIEKWAKSYDLDYPFKGQQEDTGGSEETAGTDPAGGAGSAEEEGENLAFRIQEMQASMTFLMKMIEELAYQPVVEEALLAVE